MMKFNRVSKIGFAFAAGFALTLIGLSAGSKAAFAECPCQTSGVVSKDSIPSSEQSIQSQPKESKAIAADAQKK